MIIDYFNIHGLLSMAVQRDHAHPLDGYMLDVLKQYKVDKNASSDLIVIVKPLSNHAGELPGATILDDRWRVCGDSIYVRERHKGARWTVLIDQLAGTDSPCTITIGTNHLGRMVFPADYICPAIRCLMNYRGVADVHGASVCKDGKGFLFAGRSGTGKTVTAINFIREGYGLLADDESWLHKGRILSYLGPLNIRYTYDPRVALGLKLSMRQRGAVFSRKLLAILTAGQVTLFTNFKPEQFGASASTSARLKKAYLCLPGDSCSIDHDVDPEDFLGALVRNNRFEMSQMEGIRLAYVCARPQSRMDDYWELHRSNLRLGLQNVQCNRLFLPRLYTQSTFERIHDDVER